MSCRPTPRNQANGWSQNPRILDKSSSSSQIQIQTATWLLDEVYSKLASCPSDYYVIASQPGVHSADFSSSKSAPRLGAKMLKEASGIRSSLTVNEVADVVDAKQIRDMIVKTCGAGNTAVDASSEFVSILDVSRGCCI